MVKEETVSNGLGRVESESESHLVVSGSLRPHGLYSPWNSPGQNTGMRSHFLLQEIFPTQGLNLGLLHCRQMLYHLSHADLNKIPYDNTVEVTNRFKGLDLTECLKNYGWRFITLHRKW